jgi:hypothetical protein
VLILEILTSNVSVFESLTVMDPSSLIGTRAVFTECFVAGKRVDTLSTERFKAITAKILLVNKSFFNMALIYFKGK